jgi:putative copper export protein/mono/diheme cytochrome c family protein
MSMADAFLVLARFLHYAALTQLAGALCFATFIAGPLDRRLRAIAWAGLALALASGLLWFLLEVREISGEALSLGAIGAVASRTGFGIDFTLRCVAALLLAPCLATRRVWPWVPALLAALLLGGMAWAGHAGATPGTDGKIHLASDVIHLLAAGAWLGGLAPLALYVTTHTGQAARQAAKKFSTMGVIALACLVMTGIINTRYLVIDLPGLIGTQYGHVLCLKILLFLVMLAFAATNRYRLLPALDEGPALRHLARNSATEAVLGVGVLFLVGLLGTLIPGGHDQPVWPLSFRYSGEVLQAPELRGAAIEACCAVALGIVFLLAAAFWLRRLWWAVVPLALVLFIFFAPSLKLFTVEAFPTSYAHSPTGYSAEAIAQGAKLFAANCTLCHGAGGKGDGPALKSLGIVPAEADLTAAHIYDHAEGDLYWWVSHGIEGTPMPGFAGRLTADERWALIDFVHANADGARLAPESEGIVATPVRAPVFAVTCPDGTAIDLAEPSERVIRLVFPAAEQPELSIEGFITVVAASEPIKGVCTAPETLAAAYGVLVGGSIAGDQFLIDGAGWVRAYWRADAARALTADALADAMHTVLHNPFAAPPSSGHHHHG